LSTKHKIFENANNELLGLYIEIIMQKKFKNLISLIDNIKNDEYGSWIYKTGHKGTNDDPIPFPFVSYSDSVNKLIELVYKFEEDNPEYELCHYYKLLNDRGLEWNMKSLEEADVSKMDAQGIMAMLMGIVRAERFCDGAILSACRSGIIIRWLERLRELISEK